MYWNDVVSDYFRGRIYFNGTNCLNNTLFELFWLSISVTFLFRKKVSHVMCVHHSKRWQKAAVRWRRV